MPNDVFDALEDIEFPFLREALEAEFKSKFLPTYLICCLNPAYSAPAAHGAISTS